VRHRAVLALQVTVETSVEHIGGTPMSRYAEK
jgi:hypothetical protein